MIAAVFRGPGRIEVDDVARPALRHERDAIVRVTRAGICGTDLHPYRGEIPGFRAGTVLGHEIVGVVEDVGPDVANVSPGDRVVVSDVIACGRCHWCLRGWHYHCRHVSLFGYDEVVGPYMPGGQAEAVHVPFADVVLAPLPDNVTDEQALFVGDILTTGWTGAAEAGIEPGDVVAVVGCGPVGLCAARAAPVFGAAHVVAVDPVPRRRAAAGEAGANAAEPAFAADAVRDLTAGRGADVVLEAVGTDAALALAIDLVRPRGTIVAVGAHHSTAMPFPTGRAFGLELTLRFAVGVPIRWRDTLLPLIADGRLDPTPIVSHRLPLGEAAVAYDLFDRREATKVVLVPDE